MFYDTDLRNLDEATIQSLVVVEAEEGLRLEFKRELDLDSRDEKREAAKDVSAFANASGGRIVYGIEERELPDGRRVAHAVRALKDGSVGDRLADVLTGAIHPRPAFALRHVPVRDGVVLVVEVYGSEADLHMVSGYGESRFYRRGAKGNVLMTEPEIREAYAQAVTTQASLDDRLSSAISSELELRTEAHESIVIAPWHASPAFLDPRTLPPLHEMLGEALWGLELRNYVLEYLRLEADGYRLVAGGDRQPRTAPLYMAVRRNGVVHLSEKILRDDRDDLCVLWVLPAIRRMVEALVVADCVYGARGYFGRCRLWYIVRPPRPLVINPSDFDVSGPLPAAPLRLAPVDFLFSQLGKRYGPAIREVADQLLQARGLVESPYFSAEGRLTDAHRQGLAARVVDLL